MGPAEPEIAPLSRKLSRAYTRILTLTVRALLALSGVGILVIIAVTCTDVVLRIFDRSLTGTVDIVKIASAIVLACGLPYTTAVKGHIAIEYFFHKLSRRGRKIVDALERTAAMALFSVFCWRSIAHGTSLFRAGQVSATLEVPVFWVPYVIALSCGVVVLVILHNLLHPGKEMIKP